jgi:DNA-binding MarR family transcriptional regulator
MSTLHERWGDATIRFGFTAVPNLLLRINSLKETKGSERITSSEMFVLLIILSHWINCRSQPYPSVERIARFTGLSNRHIRRMIKDLHRKNYIIPQRHGELDGRRNSYNPRPLVDKLLASAKYLDTNIEAVLAEESVTRLEIADRLGFFSLGADERGFPESS